MEMTIIKEYTSAPDAYIDEGFLKNHGIVCRVDQSALTSLFPGTPLESIKLLVKSDEAAEAQKLLEDRPDVSI